MWSSSLPYLQAVDSGQVPATFDEIIEPGCETDGSRQFAILAPQHIGVVASIPGSFNPQLLTLPEDMVSIRPVLGIAQNRLQLNPMGVNLLLPLIPPGAVPLREWIESLPPTTESLNTLFSVTLNLQEALNVLSVSGLPPASQILDSVYVIPISEASGEINGVLIRSFGVSPLITRPWLNDVRSPFGDSQYLLTRILEIAAITLSPIRDLTEPIRRNLDVVDFTNPVQTYIQLTPGIQAL